MSDKLNTDAVASGMEDPAETPKRYNPKRVFEMLQKVQAANPPPPITAEQAYGHALERMTQNEFWRSYREIRASWTAMSWASV